MGKRKHLIRAIGRRLKGLSSADQAIMDKIAEEYRGGMGGSLSWGLRNLPSAPKRIANQAKSKGWKWVRGSWGFDLFDLVLKHPKIRRFQLQIGIRPNGTITRMSTNAYAYIQWWPTNSGGIPSLKQAEKKLNEHREKYPVRQ